MFNTIVGILIAGFGAYHILTDNVDQTILWNAKYWGSVVGGGSIALYNLTPTLYSYLSNLKLPTLPKKDTEVKELSKDIKVENEQEQDNLSLFYLAERLKDDAEALELLRKINDKLFSKHHPVKGV